MGTANRVWSTYFRYALNELEKGSKYRSTSLIKNEDQKSICEHTVPFKILRDKLLGIKDPTPDSVCEVLNKFHVVSIISADEDQRLKDMGLNSKMPKDWDGKNPFARYEVAGISVEI